jgi:hypothetical protein
MLSSFKTPITDSGQKMVCSKSMTTAGLRNPINRPKGKPWDARFGKNNSRDDRDPISLLMKTPDKDQATRKKMEDDAKNCPEGAWP